MARIARVALVVHLLLTATAAFAAVPATRLMSVYRFNGPVAVPYYDVDSFLRDGPSARPAGTLAQGSAVIPCVVLRAGMPVTDKDGTPYVGFEVIVDATSATLASTARFTEVAAQREAMTVADHRCPEDARDVIDVRKLIASDKPPRFEPPVSSGGAPSGSRAGSELDQIIRTFHASPQCQTVNRQLVGRRDALLRAWDAFVTDNAHRWPADTLARARHLDYALRTAIYEGHLGRGCSAYGACERNVIVLSIRNRGLERCVRGQGCRSAGDFEGVASTVSQYNIWDEYLTQTSDLTSCFLRPDLAGDAHYARLQAMFEQSAPDAERILFGTERELQTTFPGSSLVDLTRLRHYYHPPAMGKCFPSDQRLEYISGAIARHGDEFVLIANTYVRVDEKRGSDYLFRQAIIDDKSDRDIVRLVDRYPGFVIDGRKIQLRPAASCAPYGIPSGCRFAEIGRRRKMPSWLSTGQPLQLSCRVRSRGETCRGDAVLETIAVGGVCDTAMQPVAGVP